MKSTNANESDIEVAKRRAWHMLASRSEQQAQQNATAEKYLNPRPELKSARLQEQFPSEKPFSTHQDTAPVQVPAQSKLQRIRHAFTAPNLSVRQRLRALPLVGYAISVLSHVLRGPLYRQQHELRLQTVEALQNKVEFLNRQLNDRISALAPVLDQAAINAESNFRMLESRIAELEAGLYDKRMRSVENLDLGTRVMRLEQIAAERKLKQFSQLLIAAERDHQAMREQLATMARQIQTPSTAPQQSFQFEPPSTYQQGAKQSANAARSDAFFREFEDTFRGSREEIKKRLAVYLPYFEAQPQDQRGLTVDLGCGRGEWLELLAEHQIPAVGVDLNADKVEACIGLGLAAKTADAITFLRQQEAGSVFAVTGFHIVEHLPFDTLLDVFDAALHALQPGGLVIFETPNPENLLVGACNFYFDPTHLHPLVPAVLQFIATHSGFANAEIVRLHPYPEDHLARGDTDADRLLNRYFFGPQDYALIARK